MSDINHIDNWIKVFSQEWESEFLDIIKILDASDDNILPDEENILKVFKEMPINMPKVLIIGQDPYPNYTKNGDMEACGRAFAYEPVNAEDNHVPKSLQIIFKELNRTYGQHTDTTLKSWVNQGVMLLNASLTVIERHPNSHRLLWQKWITDRIGDILRLHPNIVIATFGAIAESVLPNKSEIANHLRAPHPAADLYGKPRFVGCNIFVEINKVLELNNRIKIQW